MDLQQIGAEASHRVLIFAPIGRDAALTRDLLAQANITGTICDTVDAVCDGIAGGAAAVILTEEVFEFPDFDRIVEELALQPPWSDIPVVMFAGSEGHTTSARSIAAIERLPNVTLLDRPIRVSVALSVVRAAVRARTRQLEVRDLLVALHASREQAETASRLKDEFLATLSHELRTPLNAILGWTAILRHGQADPPRVQRGLEVIDRNARAQAQLVEDVLDMARVITGKLRVDFRPVSLQAIIDAAVEALRPAAEAKRIVLQVQRGTDAPPIRGDADRLQQVLWNLLSNAVKFTPEAGEIAVRIQRHESHVQVSVTDSGIGIDPQFLPFVFDRFRQADQSATRTQGGLGLGLAIVKHLVELHGGHVTVDSAGIGRGATFTVVLPIPAVLPPKAAGGAASDDPFAMELPGCSILVVDDDEATRELLTELFEQTQASVRTAGSASAALLAIEADTPDLIIADIGLPGEDGHSLMRKVRAMSGPAGMVPSLALSAYTRLQDREAARLAGFTDFLGKPAAPQDILTAVGRLLAAADRES